MKKSIDEVQAANTLRDIVPKVSLKYIVFLLFFYFFIFKNPLEGKFSVFGYVDEIVAFLAFPIFFYKQLYEKHGISHINFCFVCVFFFVLCGAVGNIIFRYQSLWYSLLDCFTCIKFWLALYVGKHFFTGFTVKNHKKTIQLHCKLMIYFFIILILLDNIIHIFPANIRYGLRSTQLFYSHPTYFAAACVFICVIYISVMGDNLHGWFNLFCLLVLIASTLRIKAIGAAIVFLLIAYIAVHKRKKINFKLLLIMALIALIVGWNQIYYYFFSEIQSGSARYQLFMKSLLIANDFFPFGTGFGTFGSFYSGVAYSPVYMLYGIQNIEGITSSNPSYISDSFWPMILGQTGFLGLIAYICALLILFLEIQRLAQKNCYRYTSALCILVYLLISSTSESAFANPMAVPLAIYLGKMLQAESVSK